MLRDQAILVDQASHLCSALWVNDICVLSGGRLGWHITTPSASLVPRHSPGTTVRATTRHIQYIRQHASVPDDRIVALLYSTPHHPTRKNQQSFQKSHLFWKYTHSYYHPTRPHLHLHAPL